MPARLEDLQPNAAVRGIQPDRLVTVVSVQWYGSDALDLTYRGPDGKVGSELLYRHDEPRIEIAEKGRPWSFDGEHARSVRVRALCVPKCPTPSRRAS